MDRIIQFRVERIFSFSDMAAPPRVTIAKPNRPNGLLSLPASSTQRKSGPHSDKATPTTLARLKLVVRRLPPGLTEAECEEALGDDWKAGKGKVAWMSYRAGKTSKECVRVTTQNLGLFVCAEILCFSPAKPSRPSRAYIQLTKQEHINALSEKVRNTLFTDAKGSTKDSSLLGPPTVEFAPYGRVPNGRPRKDARQGTIDQDPEFIDFLESLTSPVTKTTSVDQESDVAKGKEKVTMTPLVQFLKDKKANKGKENASVKSTKHSRHDKDGKTADGKATLQSVASPKKRSAQAAKVEQAARDAVKVLTKQAANAKGTASAPPVSKPQTATPNVVPNSTANAALAHKQRERGNVSAAAKILQRDLGLGGGPRGRGGRHGTANAAGKPVSSNNQAANKPNAGANTITQASTPTNNTPTGIVPIVSNSSKAQTTIQPPTGPAANRAPSRQAVDHSTPQTTPARSSPQASKTTQAFLKHANPSQGITEPLLEEAFKAFGTINKVEIDKKKGFAYVDFSEPESLQKAIKASPIKVAQGQVQVLERKTGASLQARNNIRGGSPMMANNNAGRGNTTMTNNNPRIGGVMAGNHNLRGGSSMMNHRGGLPMSGRGGSTRGRGGGTRGGANMSHTGAAKNLPTTIPPPSTAATASTAPGSDPQPVATAAPPDPAPSEPSGT